MRFGQGWILSPGAIARLYCSFENVIVAELRREGGAETQIRRNHPRGKRNLAHGFRLRKLFNFHTHAQGYKRK